MSGLFSWLHEADDTDISESDGLIEDPSGEITINSIPDIDQPNCCDGDVSETDEEPSENQTDMESRLDFLFERAIRRQEEDGDAFTYQLEIEDD